MSIGIQNNCVPNTTCFSPEHLSKLTDIMYENRVSIGSQLYWEGDPADKLYFLFKGKVRITKASDDGRQISICVYQTGDLFGQIDPFHESAHFFGAKTLEESVVGIIQRKDLEVLLWQNGDLAVEFMKWMGLIHRQTQAKFRDLVLFGKLGALCSLLIRLGNTYGVEKDGRLAITHKLTNTELGEMIGATRESVNRMLGDLKRKNVISYDEHCLIIENHQYLREFCHCENCPKEICRI